MLRKIHFIIARLRTTVRLPLCLYVLRLRRLLTLADGQHGRHGTVLDWRSEIKMMMMLMLMKMSSKGSGNTHCEGLYSHARRRYSRASRSEGFVLWWAVNNSPPGRWSHGRHHASDTALSSWPGRCWAPTWAGREKEMQRVKERDGKRRLLLVLLGTIGMPHMVVL